MPATSTRIAATTATMYGSPTNEQNQNTSAAASTAITMPINLPPSFR